MLLIVSVNKDFTSQGWIKFSLTYFLKCITRELLRYKRLLGNRLSSTKLYVIQIPLIDGAGGRFISLLEMSVALMLLFVGFTLLNADIVYFPQFLCGKVCWLELE